MIHHLKYHFSQQLRIDNSQCTDGLDNIPFKINLFNLSE
jgi:hypothetical protein